MEDWNMLAADCVVLSCCCQCLILQIVIFALLKFPVILYRKTKQYAKKKLRRRRKEIERRGESLKGKFEERFVAIQVEEAHGGGYDCMEEVERVLKEFSQKGEFAFGSFWGRKEGSSTTSTFNNNRENNNNNVDKQEIDFSVVQFEFVEIVSSLSYYESQVLFPNS